MKKLAILAAFLSVAAAFSCTAGGSSGQKSTAPGSTTPPPGSAPAPVATPVFTGDVAQVYTLVDPASAPGSIVAEFSTDGGATWNAATPSASSEPTSNLATSPTGVAHTFVWNTLADLGAVYTSNVRERISSGGTALVLAAFDVDDRSLGPGPKPAPTPTPTPQPKPTQPSGLPQSSVPLLRGPYLTGASGTTMTIMWTTGSPTDTVIQYASAASGSLVAGNPNASETAHKVAIAGLTAGTAYSYRIVTHTSGSWAQLGNIFTFTTAAASSAPSFSLVAMGDTGQNTPAQTAIGNLLAGDTFDFLMHTGDVIYPNGLASDYDTKFFPQYGAFISSRPFFGAVGNHDLDTLGGQPYLDVFNPTANNPQQNGLYYSFTWGNAKFISIDSTGLFQANGPHGTWFQGELANNTSRWLVVVMHAPLYSADDRHGDDATLQSLWQPMMEQYKVDAVIAGHAHCYERFGKIKTYSTDPTYGGWIEIVTGGGGAPTYAVTGTSAQTPLVTASANHYTKLTFTQNELRVKAVRADGTVLESVTIPHN